MPLEHEIKFPVADFDDLRRRLNLAGAVCLGRVFESNIVYDDARNSLRAANILLRLRRDGQGRLTLKRPPAARDDHAGLKVLEEFETRVDDPSALEAILHALGYKASFAYEKVRETWDIMAQDGVVHVCLDRLPFGRFVELEGPARALEAAAGALGLSMNDGLTDNYHALHRKYLAGRGLEGDDSFVFTGAERAGILADPDMRAK